MQISIDENQKPCIIIFKENTDDVRDILIDNFLQTISHYNTGETFFRLTWENDNKIAKIKNITLNEILKQTQIEFSYNLE